MPTEQRHEFNRYMGLAFVCGCQFGALLHVIANKIENLHFNLGRIEMLDQAAALLEEDSPQEVAARRVRQWRRKAQVTVPEFLRGLSGEMREEAFKELSLRWQELRALPVVTEEIASRFDDEDPLFPEVREKVQRSKQAASELNEQLSNGKVRRLPEPRDAHVELVRELVEQRFQSLDWWRSEA